MASVLVPMRNHTPQRVDLTQEDSCSSESSGVQVEGFTVAAARPNSEHPSENLACTIDLTREESSHRRRISDVVEVISVDERNEDRSENKEVDEEKEHHEESRPSTRRKRARPRKQKNRAKRARTTSSSRNNENKEQKAPPDTTNENVINSLAAQIKCGICQYTVAESKSPIASTTCGHLFCQKCIRKAVRLTKSCPTCRKKIGLKDVHRVYF